MMGVHLFCSATGSPGVTTTVVGLALGWPRDVLVADCDRDPGQTVEAGYLRGMAVGDRGLAYVARAHRERVSVDEEVGAQAIPLRGGATPECRYLPGFTHPGAANVFVPVWPELATAFRHLSEAGCDVLVDAGRVGRDGLPPGLLRDSDTVLMVVRSSLRSLAAARLHLAGLQEHMGMLGVRADLGLVVVGPDRPYSAKEIAREFHLPVAACLPFEPQVAAVMSDGAAEPRRFRESRLVRSFRTAAAGFVEQQGRTVGSYDTTVPWAGVPA